MTEPAEITPLPSATILVIRDRRAGGIEVLMQQRHANMKFMPNALVFPGGKVDKEDAELVDRLRGSEGQPAEIRALQVAAIREAFEEAGLLLARRRGSTALITGAEHGRLGEARSALNARKLTFAAFAEAEDLELAGELLVPFANWVTPRRAPQRFDAHFFLAPAPPGQDAAHDDGESVDTVWIAPEDALTGAKDGSRPIVFPTYCNLYRLGENVTVATAMAAAASKSVIRIEPWMEDRPEGRYTCIPKDVGYAVTEMMHGVLKGEGR